MDSEKVFELLNDFVNAQSDSLICYKSIKDAKSKWCKWMKILVWLIYFLIAWQAAAFLLCGIFYVSEFCVEKNLIISTAIPTALIFFFWLSAWLPILKNHDIILNGKGTYNGL